MKEFTSAVTEVVEQDALEAALAERESKIQALIDGSKAEREEFIAARIEAGDTKAKAAKNAPKVLTRKEAEEQVPEVESEKPVEFMLDGRVMHSYPLAEGQLIFLLASMGRGQTDDARFAAITNVLLESLRADDKDYFISRMMLSKSHPNRLKMDVLEQVFEYLMEEWFEGPTQ